MLFLFERNYIRFSKAQTMINKTISSILYSFIISILFFGCTNNEQPKTTQNENTIETKTNLLFIGTYTKKEGHVDGKAEGIYVYNLDPETGSLTHQSTAKEAINPSFLTHSFDGKFLYAVNETGPDVDTAGTISAFSIDAKTKSLKFLNTQSTDSFAPCHVSVDSKNQVAFVTNYVGGKVVIFPINEDGTLEPAYQEIILEGKSVHPRQESSHPHSIVLSPDERFAYVSDLGTDKIMIYEVDYEVVKLIPTKTPFVKVQDGSGPRHFTFHPNGKFAYVINELNNTITAFKFNAENGELTEIENVMTMPSDYKEDSFTADIHITPDGKFLYGSNRGHDSIVAFKIDQSSGKLTLLEHQSTQGSFPRNFMISDNGKFLYAANQNSDNIVIFKIETNGALAVVDQIKVATPVCLKMQ